MAGKLIYDASTGRYQYVIGMSGGSAKAVKKVDTIAERDALLDKTTDVMVMLAYLDDSTVDSGWAIYTWLTKENRWEKTAEKESMDVLISLESLGLIYTAEQFNEAVVNAHIHVTDDNTVNKTSIYACAPGSTSYAGFSEISIPTDIEDITNFKARYNKAVYIGDGKPYYINTTGGAFTGASIDASKGVHVNVSSIGASNDILAIVDTGKLYVLATSTISGYTGIAGSLLGLTNYKPSSTTWTQVGTDETWISMDSLFTMWAGLKGDGNGGRILMMAGYNTCYQLGSAVYANPTSVEVPAFLPTDGANPENPYTVFGSSPKLLNTPQAITVIEGTQRITPTDWLDYAIGGYFMMARRAVGTDGKGKLYTWGRNHCGELGDGVHYKHDMADNDPSTRYGFQAGTTPCMVGNPEPRELAVGGVVYTDWVDYDAGWYHGVALRYNANGESEVYVWGSNEYGCLGNGNYDRYRLNPATGEYTDMGEGVFEYVDTPHKLTTAEFPFTDVVNVEANHYATILTRANGDVYYAGCNKRNQLGITSIETAEAMVPTFTKMSSFFNGGTWDAETYGGFILRPIPHLTDEADPVFKTIFTDELSVDKLAMASILSHRHTASVEDIDAVVFGAKSFLINYKQILRDLHSGGGFHTNLPVLNGLGASGKTLLFQGNPVGGGESSGGTATVMVDISNRQLDDLTDVTGLNNLAGGMGLEVISYYRYDVDASNTHDYIMRVAPSGGTYHVKDRWVDLYWLNGTTYTSFLSADIQRGGVYAVPSNNTAKGKLLNCTKDLQDVITTAKAGTNATIALYHLNAMDKTRWNTGRLILTIAKEYISGARNVIYYKMGETGSYKTLDTLESIGLNEHYDETPEWLDLYDSAGELLVSSENEDLFYSDGTSVPNSGDIVRPKSYEEDTPIYLAVYDNEELEGEPVVAVADIQAGLFRKEGTSLQKVTILDIPETFCESLFDRGVIHVLPGKNDYTGPANQEYSFSACQFIYSETDSTKLESVVLRLVKPVTTDGNQTSETFMPGSIEDPMMAVMYSPYRAYTSSVTGEYNSAVGFNSVVSGNNNDVFGHFSAAHGVGNIVVGTRSYAFGQGNTLCADGSFVHGSGNRVGGTENFVLGDANMTYGYYGTAIGSRNSLFGVSNFAIGHSNELFGNRSIAVGSAIKIFEGGEDCVAIGTNIESYAKKAFIVGKNGRIDHYEGNFPDLDTAYTMTLTAFNNAGYDKSGWSNEDALIFTMGDGIRANTGDPLTVMAYRKWRWKYSAAFFNTPGTGSTNRKMDPRYMIPAHGWDMTGTLEMSFCTPLPIAEDSSGNKRYQTSFRNSGRVMSCDPGMIVQSDIETHELNFDLGYKFKITGRGVDVTPKLVCGIPDNGSVAGEVSDGWPDGAEGYIVAYGTNIYSWPSDWVWTNASPASLSSASVTSFALVKLMVVDGAVIATTVSTVTR